MNMPRGFHGGHGGFGRGGGFRVTVLVEVLALEDLADHLLEG